MGEEHGTANLVGATLEITEPIARRIRRFMKQQAGALEFMREVADNWDASISFDAARQGGWAVRKGNVVLDSTYNPQKAAASFLNSFEPADNNFLVLVGAGGGSLPIALSERVAESKTKIAVYEPSPSILLGLFTFNEEIDRLDPEKIQFFCRHQAFRFYLLNDRLHGNRVAVLCPPSYERGMHEELVALRAIFDESIAMLAVTSVTSNEMTQRWLRNLASNLPQRLTRPLVYQLEQVFQGVPAVLVSSGPSLDQNIAVLRENAEKVLIMCVNSSLRALVNHGIKPHLIFAIEATTLAHDLECLSQLEYQPALVLGETCDPLFFQPGLARTFILPQAHLNYQPFMKAVTGSSRGFPGSASVSNMMFCAALMMGCDPIVCIGQDLAFSGDRVYAQATDYGSLRFDTEGQSASLRDEECVLKTARPTQENQRTGFAADQQILTVPSWDGKGTARTTPNFNFIRTCLQEEAHRTQLQRPRQLINATEGGAHIEGFAHRTLDDVLGGFKNMTRDLASETAKHYCEASRLNAAFLERGLERIGNEIEAYAASAGKTLQILGRLAQTLMEPGKRDLAEDVARFNKAKASIMANNLVDVWIETELKQIADQKSDGSPHHNFVQARATLKLMIKGCGEVKALINSCKHKVASLKRKD